MVYSKLVYSIYYQLNHSQKYSLFLYQYKSINSEKEIFTLINNIQWFTREEKKKKNDIAAEKEGKKSCSTKCTHKNHTQSSSFAMKTAASPLYSIVCVCVCMCILFDSKKEKTNYSVPYWTLILAEWTTSYNILKARS